MLIGKNSRHLQVWCEQDKIWTEKKEPIWGQARGGTTDERVEKDTKMDRQIDEDDEEHDKDVPPLSKITDHHGDLPASQSVSHIHSWPPNSTWPHPDTHNGSSVCVYVCVSQTAAPLAGTLDRLRTHTAPYPSHVWHWRPSGSPTPQRLHGNTRGVVIENMLELCVCHGHYFYFLGFLFKNTIFFLEKHRFKLIDFNQGVMSPSIKM